MKEELPVISAILLLRERQYCMVEYAIKNFLSQSYPRKELVIVNNAGSQFAASGLTVTAHKNVIIFDTPTACSAGMAMNYGISVASGQILTKWGVDYYYEKSRLSQQVNAMISNESQMCFLNNTLHYNSSTNWCVRESDQDFNTLMCVRHQDIDYDDVRKYEDVQYASKLSNVGFKAVAIDGSNIACRIFGYGKLSGKINYFGDKSEIFESHYEFIKSGVRNRIKNMIAIV